MLSLGLTSIPRGHNQGKRLQGVNDSMLIPRTLGLILPLSFLILFSAVNAAELRGQLSGIANASVKVNCPGGGGSSTISSSGSYSVKDLPAGKNCSFSVSQGAAKSVNIPFSTARSVTVYSGQLRLRGNRILVLRQ